MNTSSDIKNLTKNSNELHNGNENIILQYFKNVKNNNNENNLLRKKFKRAKNKKENSNIQDKNKLLNLNNSINKLLIEASTTIRSKSDKMKLDEGMLISVDKSIFKLENAELKVFIITLF